MNAADKKQVRKAQAEEKRTGAADLVDLETVMRTPHGRRFVYRVIFEMSGVERLSFAPLIHDGACAAQHMAFSEGQRHVGRTLAIETRDACPELYHTMIRERLDRDAAEAVKSRATVEEPDNE